MSEASTTKNSAPAADQQEAVGSSSTLMEEPTESIKEKSPSEEPKSQNDEKDK